MTQLVPDTLPEQVLLLACDPDRPRSMGTEVAVTVRGALLLELGRRGCLVEENDTVRPSGTRRTGHPVLDGVLARMSERPPHRWRYWVRADNRQTLAAVRERLAATGVIAAEPGRVLGIVPIMRIAVRQPAPVAALRDGVLATVRHDAPASDEAAALVALVTTGLPKVLSRREQRAHQARIRALTDQATARLPGVRPVLRQIKATRASAEGGGG